MTMHAAAPSIRTTERARWWRALARHRTLLLVAFGAVAAAAAWLRLPAIARDTLWAEDGRTFLQHALDTGPIASLVTPYAGYLHTVPRLLASVVVSFVPVSDWALGMTAGSCVVAGVLAAAILVATRDVVRWMPARVAIAALTVLAPLAPREVLGNAANLHSLFLWALLWIALARPRTRRTSIGLAIVALLGALTEIQVLFVLPLLVFGLRDRRRWPVGIALLVGSAAQLVATLSAPRAGSQQSAESVLSIAYGYLINGAMPLAVPQNSIGRVAMTSGPALGIAVLALIGFAALLVVRRGTPGERLAVVSLLVGSVVVFAASLIANPHPFTDYSALTGNQMLDVWLVRYGVVPSMMLAAVIPISLGVALASRKVGTAVTHDPRSIALAIVGALLAVSIVIQFVPTSTRRSSGPTWQPQVIAAHQTCHALPPEARVDLKETIGWYVSIPCELLNPSAGNHQSRALP